MCRIKIAIYVDRWSFSGQYIRRLTAAVCVVNLCGVFFTRQSWNDGLDRFLENHAYGYVREGGRQSCSCRNSLRVLWSERLPVAGRAVSEKSCHNMASTMNETSFQCLSWAAPVMLGVYLLIANVLLLNLLIATFRFVAGMRYGFSSAESAVCWLMKLESVNWNWHAQHLLVWIHFLFAESNLPCIPQINNSLPYDFLKIKTLFVSSNISVAVLSSCK